MATIEEGEIEITNDGQEIEVDEGCELNADPGTGLIAAIASPVNTHIQIKPGGSLTVHSGATFRAGGWVTNEGSFTLMPDANAVIPGIAGNDIAYLQISGHTLLYGGSVLYTDAGNYVEMEGGTLGTVSAAGIGSGGCSAEIMTGEFVVTGGNIYINFGAEAHTTFGTLKVTGDVFWSGGTFHPFVQDGTANADLLDIIGTLTTTVNGTAALTPHAIDAEWVPCMPTSNSTWLMIRTSGGITPNNNPPSFTSGGIWLLDPITIGGVLKRWDLKAV